MMGSIKRSGEGEIAMEPRRDLSARAVRQAERAGLRVSPGFLRMSRELSEAGLNRAREGGVEDPGQRTGDAFDQLVGQAIQIARSRDDDVLEPEHMEQALQFLCPLWPFC